MNLDDPMLLAFCEKMKELLPGRNVQIGWLAVSHATGDLPGIIIDSCYHNHKLIFFNGTIRLIILHKFTRRGKRKTDSECRREDGFLSYDLNDPDSLDRLFTDILESSDHAP